MGYEIHISRRQDWFDDGDAITFDEFVRLVSGDAEFRHPGQSGADFADWRSPKTSYESWLCWSEGQIYTKNPEPELIDKMVLLARQLNAKVQGDDGEVYRSATETENDESAPSVPVPHRSQPIPALSRWPLWQRLLAAILFGCLLLALKLLFFGG